MQARAKQAQAKARAQTREPEQKQVALRGSVGKWGYWKANKDKKAPDPKKRPRQWPAPPAEPVPENVFVHHKVTRHAASEAGMVLPEDDFEHEVTRHAASQAGMVPNTRF